MALTSPNSGAALILYREKLMVCHVVHASGSRREQTESLHVGEACLQDIRNDTSAFNVEVRDFLPLENQPYPILGEAGKPQSPKNRYISFILRTAMSKSSLISFNLRETALEWLFQLLVGRDNFHLYKTLDWNQAIDRFRQPELTYPDYYTLPDYHGIPNGYLNKIAAVTYDLVTVWASPPNEQWVRRQLLKSIHGQPKRILDLGCGSGSTTVLLKQAFPKAHIIGLDLSPYMLVIAERKAQKLGLAIDWRHGLAEATGFEPETFDLVTASFLLHETPVAIAQAILHECDRLTAPGGQVLILDGNQKVLRHAQWLIDLFREPYSKVYAAGCLDDWAKAVHLTAVSTKTFGLIHQITQGGKAEGRRQKAEGRISTPPPHPPIHPSTHPPTLPIHPLPLPNLAP